MFSRKIRNIKEIIGLIEDEALFFNRDYYGYVEDRDNLIKNANYDNLKNFITKFCYDKHSTIIKKTNYMKIYNINNKREYLYYDVKYSNILYIYFTEFNNEIVNKIRQKLKETKYTKLILDLRNNCGGSVEACSNLLRFFINKNELFKLRYKNKYVIYNGGYEAQVFDDIFIFIGENTISSAEIFAYSMKENLKDKVLLIGNKTAGKGIGQSIIKYRKEKMILYMTTFEWYVNGKNIKEINKSREESESLKSIDDYYKYVQCYLGGEVL
ncbi:S41 family peptidase [Clostridium chrysemydis]|uniref:S41 family peptidase n=1 Tax=Clostridium chrysemydis TaxID=2665504 RepID=UPI0018838CF9|nr:S41 family peptidase [Clostridium chrysemydis]